MKVSSCPVTRCLRSFARRIAGALAVCHFAACAQPQVPLPEAAAAASAPAVQALLIGVTQYGEAGLDSLDGPENDVKLMRDVLTTRFAVPAQNVRVVLNPTHAVIEQQFAALRQRVRPHDFVYIHYSGHGSTAPDPAEPRGDDQTWVPHGARAHKLAGKDDWDVLDKEIALWLAPLYELTEDVVFVSDSCHSGTVSRGQRKGVRNAESVPGAHPLLGKLPKVAPPTTGLRIGAARDFETAVELDHRNGGPCDDRSRCYGVFTWHWAQALRESRPDEAWGDVFDRANARITTNPAIYQRPQIEGRADRAVFAGRFAPSTPGVEVAKVADGKVTLNAGALVGATVGSIYRSLGPEGNAQAVLKVTQVDALTSEAVVQSGRVKVADLVAESVHAYAAPRIRLHVGEPVVPGDADRVARVRQALGEELGATLAAFELVTDPERADWLLQLARPGAADAAPPPGAARRLPDLAACAAPCAPPQLWVVSRQGLLMDEHMRFDLGRLDDELPRLVGDLRTFAWAQEVRRLAAQGNGTPVRLSVTVWRPPAGDTRKCVAGAVEGSGWARFGPFPAQAMTTAPRFDDCLEFEIENRDPERTWYGYVVTVSPNLKVAPALPVAEAGADEARIPPGQRIRSAPGRLYRLNAAGRETVMLLASDGPVRVQALQQAGLRDKAQSRLEGLLAAAAGRRGELESVGSWGAQSIELLIAAP